jgi:hypothetical protein
LLDSLLKGVVGPDLYPEEELKLRANRRGRAYLVKRRVRHHTVLNRRRIMQHLWKARRSWLEGKGVEAAYRLGWAMHYIQDMCVGGADHEASEAELRTLPIPLKLIDKAAAEMKPSPVLLESVVKRIGPSRGDSAITTASAASAIAAAAVFGPLNPPEDLEREVAGKRGQHVLSTVTAVVSVLTGLAAIQLAPTVSLLFFAAAACCYALDGDYRRLRKELKWFVKPDAF